MRRTRYGRKKLRKSFKRLLPEIQSETNPFAHLKRTPAELILDQGVGRPKTLVAAMLLLNELSPTGIQLFSEAAFAGEQPLTVNIPSLRNFFVKGKVVACKELPTNPGILTARAYRYRVELEFVFQSEAERQAVREYCNYLKATFLSSAA